MVKHADKWLTQEPQTLTKQCKHLLCFAVANYTPRFFTQKLRLACKRPHTGGDVSHNASNDYTPSVLAPTDVTQRIMEDP